MISFPFDNTSQEVQDRNIDSDVFAEYLKRLTGGNNGVFAEVGTKMQVTATGGMTVKVKPGDGFIEGRIFINDSETELPISSAETLDRIDTVVVRLSKANRETTLAVVKGTASSAPSAPTLTRESGVYELGLANVLVKKNTVNITQAEVTDTRLNDQRCGVAPVLGQIDTQGLYDQYQSSLDQFLETVAQAIDGTLAGQLQANIDAVKNEIRPISTGGTGATTVAGARNALGLGNTSGALPIANGGTGKTTALEALLALGGIQIKKLWQNASPTSSFAAQRISLDLSEYTHVIVLGKLSATTQAKDMFMTPVGETGMINFSYGAGSGGAASYYRAFNTSASGIEFLGGNFAYTSVEKTANDAAIPYIIYGIKGVL